MSSIDKKKDNVLSQLKKTDKEDLETVEYLYEKKLRQKNIMITQLKSTIKEEKLKSLSFENKYKEIDSQYMKFLQGKEKLSNIIKYLQENLYSTQETAKNLTQLNADKDKHILELKKEISQQEDRILSLVQEIDNLQKEIIELNNEIQSLNTKPTSSFFEKIFK